MPSLIRKFAIVAALDGLILQPSSQTQRSVCIDYASHNITSVKRSPNDEEKAATIDSYGIVGLMRLPPYAYLLAITGRKQVARIWGAPVYAITDIALIPLTSQTEASRAISNAKIAQKNQVDSNSEGSDGDISEDEGEEDHAPPPDNVSVNTDEASAKEENKGSRSFTNIAQDVIGRRGQYGRFTERWFSRKGWVTERRMSQGMSRDAETKSPIPGSDASANEGANKTDTSGDPEVASNIEQNRASQQSQKSNTLTLLPKLLRTTKMLLSSANYFYSYDLDISQRVGSQNKFPSSGGPLYSSFDPIFFWNRHLINPFVESGQDSFALPIMQGFVGQRSFILSRDEDDKLKSTEEAAETSDSSIEKFLLTVISRRSTERPGLRYLRRGIDDAGHTANTVETEQILSREPWDTTHKIHSFVQIRGSIPLFFSQSPYSFKPMPVMQQSDESNVSAFKLHFNRLYGRYGPVQIVLLTDKSGPEAAIGEKYQRVTEQVNSDGGIKGKELAFNWFDFHAKCSGMRFDNIKLLISELDGKLDEFGTTTDSNGHTESRQKGIIRTNCMDCLDRTNVVQTGFAQRSLETALQSEGFNANFHADSSTQWFNSLWADNGDAISKQYSSTAALKGDFTRTRKRNYRGALNDLTLTLYRYYNNIVNDYFSQTTIDFLLGNASPQIFEDFEDNLMSRDPGMSVKKIQENAISTSVKIVIGDSEEDLVGGWTLLSPLEPDSIRILPLEECVLLLTDAAIYKVWFDWTIEKVSSFERIDLRNINSIMKGTYVTSTLTTSQSDESRNVGFVVGYRTGNANVSRVNTRSLSTAPGLNDETSNPLPQPSDESGDGGITAPPSDKPGQGRVMAFKALPSRSSVADEEDNEQRRSEQQTIGDICEEIARVARSQNKDRAPMTVRDGEIVSLADAKKSTGLIEQWAYSLKRMVWG